MGRKIIILNGSPRRSGNTAALTAEFTRGAKEAGNDVTEFFLGEMDINGCKGCFGGGKNSDSPCAQKKTIWKKSIPSIGPLTLLYLQHHSITGRSADS